METSQTDRIQKKVTLKATQARVWRAISDSREFGAWFQVEFDEPFVRGATMKGRVTYPGKENLTMDFFIGDVEPERYFSYRWNPYAIDPAVDYSSEPTTLVEFELETAPAGTLLTITESGFDQIPEHRRAEAFRRNSGGWNEQIVNIERHVAKP